MIQRENPPQINPGIDQPENNPFEANKPDAITITPPEVIVPPRPVSRLAYDTQVMEAVTDFKQQFGAQAPERDRVLQPSEVGLQNALSAVHEVVNDTLDQLNVVALDVNDGKNMRTTIADAVSKKFIMAYVLENQQRIAAHPTSTDLDLNIKFPDSEAVRKATLDDPHVQMLMLAVPFLRENQPAQETVEMTGDGQEVDSPLYPVVHALGVERMEHVLREVTRHQGIEDGFVNGVRSSFLGGPQPNVEAHLYHVVFRPYDLIQKVTRDIHETQLR
jgi:hypothetical protein